MYHRSLDITMMIILLEQGFYDLSYHVRPHSKLSSCMNTRKVGGCVWIELLRLVKP